MTQHPHEPVVPGDGAAQPTHSTRPADTAAPSGTHSSTAQPTVPTGSRHEVDRTAAADAASSSTTRRPEAAQPPTDPQLDRPATRGVSGTVWAALILGVIILILLLVFIIQNNVSAHFEYMAWTFTLPLGVAMLLSAIAGALVMALVGSVRIFTLRRRVHKLEKERARIKDTLG